jgi:hypothetical protein
MTVHVGSCQSIISSGADALDRPDTAINASSSDAQLPARDHMNVSQSVDI